MQFVATLLIAAAVFGVCFLVDKGFTKVVLSADYDIHVEDANRLRLVKTTA